MYEETVTIETDAADETPVDDAALAYEQGLAVGALAESTAQTEELAEETAAVVEQIQSEEQFQWQQLNSRLASIESQLAEMESRQMQAEMQTEEMLEEAITQTEGEPTLEVEVPAEEETSKPTTEPETSSPPRKSGPKYRLP